MNDHSKTMPLALKILSQIFAILLLQACARNPVTNSLDFDLVPESQELAIGREQYLPQRQQQQGDYVVDPALTRYVNDIGQRLAAVSDRQLPYEFAIVNSSDFNAWALPGGKIAVNRGLLLRLECESDLAAVLAHEIVHAAASHGTTSLQGGRKERALADLDEAVKLNADYWQHYLVRGVLQEALGKTAEATKDYERSVALLPTVEAYYSLGKLSLANNQQERAVEYFRNAWDPESQSGIEAGKMLARLDLENNPDRYLDAGVYLGDDNNIVIDISNNAELPVEVVEVELLKMRDFQYEPYELFSVEEMIPSGDGLALMTPVGPVKGKKMYKYQARVTVARVAE